MRSERRARGSALALAVFLAAANAVAEDAVDPARLAAAKVLYESGHFDDDLTLTAQLEAHAFAVAIAKRGGKPAPDTQAAIENIVLPEFTGLINQKRQIYIESFASTLSVADMQELTAFNTSPVGKKFAAIRGPLLRAVYEGAMPLVRQANFDAFVQHKDEFAKLGLTLGGAKP